MKKLFALLLTLLLCMPLFGCKGKSEAAPSAAGEPSSAPIEKPQEIENQVALSLDKSAYEPDESIAVTLDFTKLNQDTAVIVVVPCETQHGKAVDYNDDTTWVEYRWLSDFSEVPFYLYPYDTQSGLYDVRVYADAESGEELASITVAFGDASLPAGGGNAAASQGAASSDAGKGGILSESGECTQKQMEDTIASYLGRLGSLPSLTLCGGSEIYYEKAGDALNDGDIYTIYAPQLDTDGLYETMNSQLTAAGFSYEQDPLGRHLWYVDSDGEQKGIRFWPDDPDSPDGDRKSVV